MLDVIHRFWGQSIKVTELSYFPEDGSLQMPDTVYFEKGALAQQSQKNKNKFIQIDGATAVLMLSAQIARFQTQKLFTGLYGDYNNDSPCITITDNDPIKTAKIQLNELDLNEGILKDFSSGKVYLLQKR